MNSYYKIYITDPAILNDFNFSNKSNGSIIGNEFNSLQPGVAYLYPLKTAGNFMLHKIDKNRISGTKPKSAKVRTFSEEPL